MRAGWMRAEPVSLTLSCALEYDKLGPAGPAEYSARHPGGKRSRRAKILEDREKGKAFTAITGKFQGHRQQGQSGELGWAPARSLCSTEFQQSADQAPRARLPQSGETQFAGTSSNWWMPTP